jgi:hypothetical protein
MIASALLWLAAADGCGPLETATANLKERFGELAHEGGIAADGLGIASVYVSKETGTWTWLLVLPDGTACFIASGSGWGAMAGAKGDPA